jgi:hypothetical protein
MCNVGPVESWMYMLVQQSTLTDALGKQVDEPNTASQHADMMVAIKSCLMLFGCRAVITLLLMLPALSAPLPPRLRFMPVVACIWHVCM